METRTYIVNVQGAIYHGDRYLVTRRSDHESYMPGEVGLPGGKTDDNDHHAPDVTIATLQREIMEEVNVSVTDIELVMTNYFEAEGDHVVNVVYLCRYADGTPRAVDLQEVADVFWLTADEILAHPDCREWTHGYIQKAEALRRQRHPQR